MTNLKPCPFCGDVPELEYGGGSCYDLWCNDCGQSVISIQICDEMTIEERMAEADLGPPHYKHEKEFVDRVEKIIIERWNTRFEILNVPQKGGSDDNEQS